MPYESYNYLSGISRPTEGLVYGGWTCCRTPVNPILCSRDARLSCGPQGMLWEVMRDRHGRTWAREIHQLSAVELDHGIVEFRAESNAGCDKALCLRVRELMQPQLVVPSGWDNAPFAPGLYFKLDSTVDPNIHWHRILRRGN